MRMSLLALSAWVFLMASSAFAQTGPTGFAVGINTGISGVDVSDGTTRYNIGALSQGLSFGLHTYSFVFLIEGNVMTFNMSLNDFIANAGVAVKWYFASDFYIKPMMGLSQMKRSRDEGTSTYFYTWGGGYTGGTFGWDFLGEENQTFRMNINVGATRHEFGGLSTKQGTVTSDVSLDPKMVGMTFFGTIGLDWYL